MPITLSTKNYTAVILPESGANCTSLKNSYYGANIIKEQSRNPFLQGMPLLFPPNRISDGKFCFDNREYTFEINEPATACHLHGNLYNAEFCVTDVSKTFVKCVFDGEYFGGLHRIRIEISYGLSDISGLSQKIKITNLSERDMPNLLGFHTTFNMPFLHGGDIRLFAEIDSETERDKNYLPTGCTYKDTPLIESLNNGTHTPMLNSISLHATARGNGKCELRDTKNKLKIVFAMDKKFNTRLFYSGTDFICLEPMNCTVNAPNVKGAEFDVIKPYESAEYENKIFIREML